MRTVCCQRAAIVIAALACASFSCTAGQEEKFANLELKSIYSSFGQDNLKVPPETKAYLALVHTAKEFHGASNIFLVRGRDIEEAMRRTHQVVIDGAPGDRMFLDGPEKGQGWLVVYLGIGASGPEWTIHSVEQSAKTLRVRYRYRRSALADMRRYYAWIPLGELVPGKVVLQLWNHDADEQSLARTFLIAKDRK